MHEDERYEGIKFNLYFAALEENDISTRYTYTGMNAGLAVDAGKLINSRKLLVSYTFLIV